MTLVDEDGDGVYKYDDYDESKNKVWEPAHQLELVTKDAKGDPSSSGWLTTFRP